MKKLFLAGFLAIGLLAAGCSKEQAPEYSGETGTGKIKISVQSGNTTPAGRAIGAPSQTLENTVKSFTVYVFNNATGVLEKSQTFNNTLNGEMSGLSVASAKKVVVFVNQPASYSAIANYSDFAGASAMISIDSQVPGDFSTNGLFMSGEYPTAVQLSAANVVNVPVTVERLTAKIRLGSLTVTPDANLSLGDFVITGVSAQMVRDKARALGTLASSGFGYVSGVVPSGDQSGAVVKSFLNSPYTLPGGYTAGTTLNPEAYFYVFPNDDADNKVTMLNIYGTYLGEPMYFPFVINAEASTEGGNTTDGTWIQRNMVYTLNVHLKKIGSGSDNPNIPNEEVSMEVTVSVEDWAGELIQNVEW